MDQETQDLFKRMAEAQIKTADTVADLSDTVSSFIQEQRITNREQAEINKSLKAGQEQLSAIANKILDDQ